MSYVIDCRIRPPYKSFLTAGIFKGWDPISAESITAPQWFRKAVPSQRHGSMDEFLHEMDDAGIVKAVVMGRRTNDTGICSGQIDNAEVHDIVEQYPDRFIGFAGINPLEEGCLDDIRRCHAWGFKGISVEPGMLNPSVFSDDKRLYPVYELVNELGMVLTLNISCFVGPDISYANPVHVQHVAQAFPNLKILVSHAAWPDFDRMLAVCLLHPNVYLAPDYYFYSRNMPFADQLVRAGNSWMRHRIVFNSSYPVCGLKQAVEQWAGSGLDDDAITRQLYWNAKTLLGL
ncbi:amidohydrolase family protein [uncultured Mailhella sp.]|uniref:amidohydrolase family protein n=1 Tax=uncultured Mailhella sp. TaxID=1981031 RepID=UPI0025F711F3|nr:amidohydrolase family protein [uncultured Mailhella sp.]